MVMPEIKRVTFSAAGYCVELTTSSPLLAEYFRWKTALLPAEDGMPRIRVRLVIGTEPPAGESYRFIKEVKEGVNQGTRLWQDGSTGDSLILIPPEIVDNLIANSSMLAPLLACIFAQRGILLLHGAAVTVGGRTVLIAGYSGSGKTTLTASCLLRGCGYLSDDTLLMRNGILYPLESTIHPLRDLPFAFGPGVPFYPEQESFIKRHLDLSLCKDRFEKSAAPSALLCLKRLSDPDLKIGPCSFSDFLSVLLTSSVLQLEGERDYIALFHKQMRGLGTLPAWFMTPGDDPDKNCDALESAMIIDNQ